MSGMHRRRAFHRTGNVPPASASYSWVRQGRRSNDLIQHERYGYGGINESHPSFSDRQHRTFPSAVQSHPFAMSGRHPSNQPVSGNPRINVEDQGAGFFATPNGFEPVPVISSSPLLRRTGAVYATENVAYYLQPSHSPYISPRTAAWGGPWSTENRRINDPRFQTTEAGNDNYDNDLNYEGSSPSDLVYARSSISFVSGHGQSGSDSSVDLMGRSTVTVPEPLHTTDNGSSNLASLQGPDRASWYQGDQASLGLLEATKISSAPNSEWVPLVSDSPALEEHQEYLSPNRSQTNTSRPSGESIHCYFDGCNAQFTGDYAKGNLARHNRVQHGGRIFPCEGLGCQKTFKRKDARLKHYYKHHPELTQGPARPRRSG